MMSEGSFLDRMCWCRAFRLLPVVEQLYWGYWVKATARSMPSLERQGIVIIIHKVPIELHTNKGSCQEIRYIFWRG